MLQRFVCTVIIVLAGACAASGEPSKATTTASVAGRWEGVAAYASGLHITMVVDIAKAAEGGWAGSAIFPGFGVKGAPLGDMSVDTPAVAFTVKGAMGDPKIAARLGEDGALSGTYEQAGSTLHLSLKRVGEAQVDYPRQSTAIQKELEGSWEGALDIGTFKMRLGLKLANSDKGPASGQLLLLYAGDYAPPVDWISQERDNFELSVPAVNFGYEGRFEKASDEVKGILRVGSLEFPLAWHRAAK